MLQKFPKTSMRKKYQKKIFPWEYIRLPYNKKVKSKVLRWQLFEQLCFAKFPLYQVNMSWTSYCLNIAKRYL